MTTQTKVKIIKLKVETIKSKVEEITKLKLGKVYKDVGGIREMIGKHNITENFVIVVEFQEGGYLGIVVNGKFDKVEYGVRYSYDKIPIQIFSLSGTKIYTLNIDTVNHSIISDNGENAYFIGKDGSDEAIEINMTAGFIAFSKNLNKYFGIEPDKFIEEFTGRYKPINWHMEDIKDVTICTISQ